MQGSFKVNLSPFKVDFVAAPCKDVRRTVFDKGVQIHLFSTVFVVPPFAVLYIVLYLVLYSHLPPSSPSKENQSIVWS